MKCYTCFTRPGNRISCDPGVSLIKDLRSEGHPYIVRLGLNGFLSNECYLQLSGDCTPDIQTGPTGLKTIYDAFPVEIDKGQDSHKYCLSNPIRDDKGVALVRFDFGKQVPANCRRDVFPVEGRPSLIAVAMCAMDRRSWPLFAIDGIWVVGYDDVFAISDGCHEDRVSLKENGMILL